jgi:guanine deaminase
MKAFRARILDFIDDPLIGDQAWRYFADGLLIVDQGKVQHCGDYQELKSQIA